MCLLFFFQIKLKFSNKGITHVVHVILSFVEGKIIIDALHSFETHGESPPFLLHLSGRGSNPSHQISV